jgi:hypothetical protein
MAKKPRKRRRKARGEILLSVPEQIVVRLAVAEHLLGDDRDDDVEPGLELRIEEASQEIAQALIETGRPLRHLHLLREALDRRGARRGYKEGAAAVASIVNAMVRDAK